MERNRKGDLAEILAVAWLLEQGYEVFRNVSCVGPIDLVVYMEGRVKLVDVKTLQTMEVEGKEDYSFSYSRLTEKQREMDVKPLWVDMQTKRVGWNRDYF